jgi:hypothetical protein
MSKGLLIVGTRVAPSSEKFNTTISTILRFSLKSAVGYFSFLLDVQAEAFATLLTTTDARATTLSHGKVYFLEAFFNTITGPVIN